MLQNGTYKKTKDYIEQNIVFRQLEAVLSIAKNGNKETFVKFFWGKYTSGEKMFGQK